MATRKLFLIHASELAHRLVRTTGAGGLVVRFLHFYSQRYGRPGLVSNPERVRELESTIGREAMLVMTAEIRHLLPNAFASRRGALRPEEAVLVDTFYAEFLASVGRSLEWAEEEAADEADAFRRDLEIYQRWKSRQAGGVAARPRKSDAAATVEESPFSDRCALLLDSAMMEQARRAAAAFELEVARTASRVFSSLGRRAIRGGARSRPAKPARPRAAHKPLRSYSKSGAKKPARARTKSGVKARAKPIARRPPRPARRRSPKKAPSRGPGLRAAARRNSRGSPRLKRQGPPHAIRRKRPRRRSGAKRRRK